LIILSYSLKMLEFIYTRKFYFNSIKIPIFCLF